MTHSSFYHVSHLFAWFIANVLYFRILVVVMGSILGCRSAAMAMAAGISLGRSPFFRIDAPRKQRGDDEEISIEDLKRRRVLEERSKYLKSVGNSDHAFLAALFLKWKAIGAGGGARKAFCDSLGLSFTGMRDMLQLADQLDGSLKTAGFVPTPESDQNGKSWRIIHSCAGKCGCGHQRLGSPFFAAVAH